MYIKHTVPKAEQLISFFKRQGGIARFSAVVKAGFHPDSLIALQKAGIVAKLSRGLYRLAHQPPPSNPDLVTASLKVPKGVICLLSALAFHEATDEIPQTVNLAIPRGSHANKIDYPPIQFYRFEQKSWEAGIEEHSIDDHPIRMYSLAKTIADSFKFRNKIGIDTARKALKEAVVEKQISPNEIMHYSKICRVHNIIKPFLESLL